MTVLRSKNAPISLNRGKPISTSTAAAIWVRPSDWITFVDPSASEQKVIGTVAVFNQASNYIAFNVTITDATQYTVDWGDGTTSDHNSGSTAEKNYVWSDISSSTETSIGYRQAIITITPKTAGKTFSQLSLSRRHSAIANNNNSTNPWLDIAISAPNATVLDFSQNVSSSSTDRFICAMLEQVKIIALNATNINAIFRFMYKLQSIQLFNTSNVTNMGNMFQGCTSLQTVPLFDTSSVTTMQNMFNGCSALVSIPLFNTSSLTNGSTMFNVCRALREIPELDLSKISSNTNNNLGLGNSTIGNAALSLGKAKITGNKWSQSFQNCRLGAAELDEMYTALATLNPAVTDASGNGTTVTYTVGVGNISPFVAGRTVTMTGIDPVAYNLTNATIASVNTGAGTFTVTNAATGAFVSGGTAAIVSDRTVTVTSNPGLSGDDPTIATNKGWTVTEV